MGEIPIIGGEHNIIVKHRPKPTYRTSVILEPKYWKNKDTGIVVEATHFQYDVDNSCYLVIFKEPDLVDPKLTKERRMPFKSRPHPFFKGEVERGFEDEFEKYGNFSTRI